ncbi:hypothetical protein ABPG75_003068 [Micractinium tetrahymenae]
MGQAESVPAAAEGAAAAPQPGEGRPAPSALVIVGPSGVGKGTLINRLMESDPRFGFSCSHTTRPPREGEVNGVHYHFTTHEAFESGIQAGKFLEYAHVHKNIYGTSVQAVQDVADSGRCCVLDIDVQGARQVRKSGLKAVFVFIAPPSLEELEHRLRGRATDSEEQITTRLRNAQEELESVKEAGLYDYVVVNGELDEAYRQLSAIAQRALAGEVGGPESSGAGAAAAAAATAAAAAVPLGGAGSAGPSSPTPTTGGSAALNSAATFKTWLPGTQQPGSPPAEQQQLPAGAAAAAAASYGLERHRGRVALVTGAGSGVGWELATTLALAGLRVVAVSRRKAQLERLQQAVLDAGVPPAEFLPVVCDLAKEAEVAALPRIVQKRWPGSGIDLVVNSAAVSLTDVSLMSGNTESWVETVSTNVLGTAMVTREAVQDMEQRQQWGHIVNIACAEEGSGMHAATKQAVCAMAQELRLEARARGVPLRVSTITPTALNSYFFRTRAAGNKTPAALSTAAAGAGSPTAHAAGDAGAAAADDGAGEHQQQPLPGAGVALLHAADVVQAVIFCLSAPDHVDVSSITVRATHSSA